MKLRSVLVLVLGSVALTVLGPARALASDPTPPRPAPQDAGSAKLSAEDQEVVQNLELLEHLQESRELDTMLQLSQVQSTEEEGAPDGGVP